jgi:hypothetical protein
MNDTQQAKRGRKPAQESRSAEISERIARWKAVPFDQRPPITEVARELGISHQLASYHASQVPSADSRAKAIAQARANIHRNRETCGEEIEKLVRGRGKLSRRDRWFLRIEVKIVNKKKLRPCSMS